MAFKKSILTLRENRHTLDEFAGCEIVRKWNPTEAVMSSQPSRSSINRSALPPVASVPLLDVSRENAQLEPELLAAITQVHRSGRFVLGPEVVSLEQRISRLCQAPHAIGCASGSDALLLALMAADIQPGDEVIVPSFTFFATASAVTRLKGVPVFVDIEPDSYNICPAAIEAAITPKTKAIIPVHLFGLPANMPRIMEIAERHDVLVIEDAAQAIDAKIDGQPVGSWGHMACFSFYPTKNLGGYGDGGMLTSTSDELAARLKLLRVHGMEPRYYHEIVGINSRLDTLQAAVLNVKLPQLPQWTQARQQNAERYVNLLAAAGLTEELVVPRHNARFSHVWNQFTVRVAHSRDELRNYLAERNVGSEIYYPIPLHQQRCFVDIPQRFELPETERAAREVLSLPIFPLMTIPEQEYVVSCLGEFVSAQRGQAKAA